MSNGDILAIVSEGHLQSKNAQSVRVFQKNQQNLIYRTKKSLQL